MPPVTCHPRGWRGKGDLSADRSAQTDHLSLVIYTWEEVQVRWNFKAKTASSASKSRDKSPCSPFLFSWKPQEWSLSNYDISEEPLLQKKL